MGFGKAFKKVVKSASTPKGLAGLVAAPFTGGTSLLLTGKEALDNQKQQKQEEQQKKAAEEQRRAVLQEELDTEERRKTKMASLAARGQRISGLASLIGGENNTLG